MKHKINSYTHLTWSSLSIFHVSVVYLSSSIFLTLKYFDDFLRENGAPPTTPLQSAAVAVHPPYVEMVENEKKLHSNSAKIAVPDWSILRSVKEPAFSNHSFASGRPSDTGVNCGNIFSLLKS